MPRGLQGSGFSVHMNLRLVLNKMQRLEKHGPLSAPGHLGPHWTRARGAVLGDRQQTHQRRRQGWGCGAMEAATRGAQAPHQCSGALGKASGCTGHAHIACSQTARPKGTRDRDVMGPSRTQRGWNLLSSVPHIHT